MRTKRLLIAAAAIAAGVISSQAQSNVYSANVVGYVNLTVAPGFNLLANQLSSTPTNTITDILSTANTGSVLQNCQVLKFLPAQSLYTIDIYDVGSGGWIDGTTGNPSVNTVAPGEGWFFYNAQPTNIVLTLVGQVPQGTNFVNFGAGFSLVGTPPPVATALDATNGFPAVQNMQYLNFTNSVGAGNYGSIIIYDVGSGGWINGDSGDLQEPVPAVGNGYFIYNPNATSLTWTNVLNIQ